MDDHTQPAGAANPSALAVSLFTGKIVGKALFCPSKDHIDAAKPLMFLQTQR
jgi:hypothetical protein